MRRSSPRCLSGTVLHLHALPWFWSLGSFSLLVLIQFLPLHLHPFFLGLPLSLTTNVVGPEFSNQNVMSAHLVTMLRSPGIKRNAAFRAVASAEEKRANANPAACLCCTAVMLPDGYPEEAL